LYLFPKPVRVLDTSLVFWQPIFEISMFVNYGQVRQLRAQHFMKIVWLRATGSFNFFCSGAG
jgi:hypothetical protein